MLVAPGPPAARSSFAAYERNLRQKCLRLRALTPTTESIVARVPTRKEF